MPTKDHGHTVSFSTQDSDDGGSVDDVPIGIKISKYSSSVLNDKLMRYKDTEQHDPNSPGEEFWRYNADDPLHYPARNLQMGKPCKYITYDMAADRHLV